MITLTPAYGRDYRSQAQALDALRADTDFILNLYGHPYDGKPVNLSQLRNENVCAVQIRYSNKRRVVVAHLENL